MNYLAQLYFKIELEKSKKSQFDFQLRVIKAENEEEALFLAKEIGLNETIQFKNINGGKVNWEFAGVTHIQALDLTENGAEIFSNTIETEKNDSFLNYIQTKSKDLALNLSKKELIYSL